MSTIYTLLRRSCIALPLLLGLTACSRDRAPTQAEVQGAMESNASDFIRQAYQDALHVHDFASIRSIVTQTEYAIAVTEVSKCAPDNTEEDTNAHWLCHVKGDITLNGRHYPIDHDIDLYHSAEERTWLMHR